MRSTVEFAPSFSLLTVELNQGETIKAEVGSMVAQQGVSLGTGLGGGLMAGLKRMVVGESIFLNTFRGDSPGAWVSLAPATPGDIQSFQLGPGDNLFIQNGAFLACTGDVQTDVKFQGLRGLLGGESLFFIRTHSGRGSGTVFYNSYGAVKELTVNPGDDLSVDTGHLVAFTDGVSYRIGKVGGLRSLIAGGEGLVMRFSGSGRVWVQTRNLVSLAEKLFPFLPTPEED